MNEEDRAEVDHAPEPRPFEGASFDVVAIIASAGGVAALRRVLSMLPADFPAAIVVV